MSRYSWEMIVLTPYAGVLYWLLLAAVSEQEEARRRRILLLTWCFFLVGPFIAFELLERIAPARPDRHVSSAVRFLPS
jgi:hypothetical protein